ncbi:MAG: efflux RND transporter periplasmic adaptor subunit, partial [Pseudomonadota bacterium]|nr:efflux RND transporter periplasmic adaptor subunit [Pseudomonadota bacterium]
MPWIALFVLLVATNSHAQQPTPVKATAVIIDTVTIEAQAVGSLQAQEHVILRSELPGRIEALHFSEGQTVRTGDILITLDAAEYDALLAESTATVQLNELSFERVQDLLQKNLTSRQSFDEVRAQLEVSQAQQQVNQVRLAKTQIIAPFSGRLGLRDISVGAYIQPGDDLITLVDSTSIKLDFR